MRDLFAVANLLVDLEISRGRTLSDNATSSKVGFQTIIYSLICAYSRDI